MPKEQVMIMNLDGVTGSRLTSLSGSVKCAQCSMMAISTVVAHVRPQGQVFRHLLGKIPVPQRNLMLQGLALEASLLVVALPLELQMRPQAVVVSNSL